MRRPDTPTGEFVEGDPTAGRPGSILTSKYMNSLLREIMNVLQAAGMSANPADDSQLKQAILWLLASYAQKSNNDATPGRFLTVGNAFGIGAVNHLAQVDLDTVRTSGIYSQWSSALATSASHYPATGIDGTGGLVVIGAGNGDIVAQIYITFSACNVYVRTCSLGTWRDWDQIVTRISAATETKAGILRTSTYDEARWLANNTTALTPARLPDCFSVGREIGGTYINQPIPGGLIIKAGGFGVVSGEVRFATPFPNFCLGVWGAEAAVPGASATDFVMFQTRDTDRFRFIPELRNKAGSYPSAASIRYFAIGG